MSQNYELKADDHSEAGFPDKTIIDLFEEQVLKTPFHTAITCNGVEMTYEALNVRVNQLAGYLLSKNVKTEDLVGICVERSIEMIVGMLAIMKAGAAYVPIDPATPRERIGYMLKDTQSSLIISSSGLSYLVEGFDSTTTVYLDLIEDELNQSVSSNPSLPVIPGNLLYVIYTSGSSGNPKGVLIEHRNVVRLFFNDQPLFQFTDRDVWTMFHSFNFDFSVWEMYGALLFGGKLVIVSKDIAKDAGRFYELMQDEGVTVLNQTPSAFNALQEVVLEREPIKALRYVIFGGEALYPYLLKRWSEVYTWCQLINMYGITETTVHVTYKKITEKDIASNVSNIGAPIPTLSVIILDEQLQLVPENLVGELCVGGEGVARGYLNRPELTAEKFITHPYRSGQRLYRSGDLARMLPDGNLEYIGRSDNQVKIRGYRIEMGEIESRMQEIAGVTQAVVIAKERSSGKYLVAYYSSNQKELSKAIIRERLTDILPAYMIPDFFVELESIPLTSNGKVNKKALPEPDDRYLQRGIYVAPATDMEHQLAASWRALLGIEKIGVEDSFFELGGNSLLAQKLVSVLKKEHGFDLPITRIYHSPTIAGLQQFLRGAQSIPHVEYFKKTVANPEIAVIGMECNFPGAGNIEQFWDVLKNGKETIRFFSYDELDKSIPDTVKSDPAYVKARGVIDDVDFFDADFFGISPRLAELMDPQQRVFLETSRNLLEKTGYLPGKKDAVTGVFAGCSTNTYFNNNVVGHRDKIERQGSVPVISVSDKDYISSRVSYQLNLSGPSVNVNTACSTSLVAIIQAVESLRAGQCDTAIAGGAAITVPVNSGHLYQEGAMLSNDGHCRPFDADAKGTVFSDGVGAVLLKRLDDAKRDRDTIYAVIRGVGVNNDGGMKGSFTAPSAGGQASAIAMAFSDAHVAPADISYIETHGTATPLGDPIEIDGLKLAFGRQSQKQFCAIGSLKSNLGHLTHAAGVAGFIKTVLSLYNRQLPPSINFKKPNPHIDFDSSPFIVNTKLRPWELTTGKRLAGVSSFGVGGTNAHVVLEEYANDLDALQRATENDTGPELVCWSAHHIDSLKTYTTRLLDYSQTNATCRIRDVAYTLHATRQDFAIRNFVVAKDMEELAAQLSSTESLMSAAYTVKEKKNNVVFLFPGQGNQYPNMGKELYDAEPVYRNAIDECAGILQQHMGEDIRSIIFTEAADSSALEKLSNTRYAQPALFVTSYALSRLYMSWGIVPAAFAGHSVGEFVGAHLAGVFSLEDVLKIVAERGRLISELPEGSMLSVRAAENTVKNLLPPALSIAAQNAAELCVVSGETMAIESFAAQLTQLGIANKLLRTSHAFHSAMIDAAVGRLKQVIDQAVLKVPRIPILSTVTAQWLKDGEATDAAYWARHARETVQFGAALKNIQKDLDPLFLETGPGSSSTIFAKQNGAGDSAVAILSSTTKDERAAAKTALGRLWQLGADIDYQKLYRSGNAVLLHSLPTYAYNRKKLWVDPVLSDKQATVFNQPLFNATAPEISIPINQMKRKDILLNKLRDIIESASGISVPDAGIRSNFAELGLDSLLLTQLATVIKKEFSIPVTFRQLSENCDSLEKLAQFFDEQLPPGKYAPSLPASAALTGAMLPLNGGVVAGGDMLSLITQQLQILSRQVAIMQGTAPVLSNDTVILNRDLSIQKGTAAPESNLVPDDLTAEERIELKKPFGATARIEKKNTEVSDAQRKYIADFITVYNKKTAESKKYTQQYRGRMADPRVVSGFKPYTKEMVYSIVTQKSKGCYLWDIDGNKYIDALNGFGSNFLGYQADIIKEAIIKQVEDGYEIGPQHFLAGEVADLVCEMTGMERAAFCNTGSEAVLGAMRIVRTVTGRDLVVAFAGSYHGIMDEVLVRGSKKLRTYPAASGILNSNVQNMLILDYGTEASLKIIAERASDIAAVLVEPVQSRRPEFQPVEFLRELRKITAERDIALVFDEVITGFRSHPGGIQALYGIRADLATYGKVAGAGISIGIIAGSREYMDALDGGYWEYGDDSLPQRGVTYFAGTFVRHPLALATTKASLNYLKEQGPGLQNGLNEKTTRLALRLNQIAEKYAVPIEVVHFSSLWKIKFKEEYPYYELLFALMRLRNIHIWDLFPCFLTTAHTDADIDAICLAFEESIAELCKADLIPQYKAMAKILSSAEPPEPGARLGRDQQGNAVWFIEDVDYPGRYIQL
ncbi:amino acid adenylation domain-containing protein [Niabella yanshanensis]|uniref:Amino acid adenylation domain-containing protein n=1 Tax=Niabella yanshanensis TaxID=577386 RepID=A0ABZ0W8R0_9BACT|nr:polyketide synthase [Niabella yanshanensis]WQD39663.1 amino acid adenylation domain-containing protein [Niabella yanshanensis]